MKVRIDHSLPDLTDEELEDLKSLPVQPGDTNSPEFKDALLRAKEVILSPQVARELEAIGVTPDELVALLLRSTNAAH